MDFFPPLKEQLFWIAILTLLSYFSYTFIKKRSLVSLTDKVCAVVSLKDILITFSTYLALSLIAVPVVFKLIYPIYIRSPLETISLFQMCFMTFIAAFLLVYVKFKNIQLFKTSSSLLDICLKVILYLIVIFPIVSLIGQLCDTFLYLAFDVKGYEQMAVTFLKKTSKMPLALFSSIVSIVLLAPIVEEILFRGLLFNFFQNRFGTKIGIIVSGILFAIFHFSLAQGFGNVSLIAALSFFGIMLAIVYHKTQSLIYPMLLHGLFNLLSTLRILLFEI